MKKIDLEKLGFVFSENESQLIKNGFWFNVTTQKLEDNIYEAEYHYDCQGCFRHCEAVASAKIEIVVAEAEALYGDEMYKLFITETMLAELPCIKCQISHKCEEKSAEWLELEAYCRLSRD